VDVVKVKPTPKPVKTQHLDEVCGTKYPERQGLSPRIIGGRSAELGEFPWQVSLVKKADYKEVARITCGGTLISTRTVLTASHCLLLPASKYQVWMGRVLSVLEVDERHQQKFNVEKYFKHPFFDSRSYRNDIAVVSLISPVKWTNYVLPACLPSRHHPSLYVPGTPGLISGWGLLDEEKTTSLTRNLQHATVPIISQADCQVAYSGLTRITSGQLCAGARGGGRDACTGDSGGPFVIRDRSSGRYYVAGVISYGIGCGREEFPGVYTRIEKYVTWVLDKVEKVENILTNSARTTLVGG